MFSNLVPRFIQILAEPETKNIMFLGCGGGYDFIHSLLLFPDLINSNKNIVIASNSFSQVDISYKNFETVYQSSNNPSIVAKLIIPGQSEPRSGYIPEKIFCDFVSKQFPNAHLTIYANCIWKFSVPENVEYLSHLISKHNIDTLIAIDGGSDSIMRGDEDSTGTIFEDTVSLVVCETLKRKCKLRHTILLAFGFGVDRFHGVSDASGLRAVAELTRMGGFLGCSSIEPTSNSLDLYVTFLK